MSENEHSIKQPSKQPIEHTDGHSGLTRHGHTLLLVAALIIVTLVAVSINITPAGAEEQSSIKPIEHSSVHARTAFDELDDHLYTQEQWDALVEEKRIEDERIAAELAAAEKAAREEAERQAAIEAEKARKANAVQLSLTETQQGSLDENAKKIYSVLKAAGLPDINIAGVLGNWETESSIDPTSIEGIYGEHYHIGSAKSAAIANPAAQAQRCFAMYASSGLKVNQSAYYRANGELWPGIGLGGFTGPAIDPLMSWSNRIGKPWYSLECQVSYAVHGYARAGWLASWTTPSANATEAAGAFLHNWEGCHIGYSKRGARAQAWYDKMRGWLPDLEYGQSVLALG